MVQGVNKNVIVTNDGRQYQKPSKSKIVAGIYGGEFAGMAAGAPILLAFQQPIKTFFPKMAEALISDETLELNDLGKEIRKISIDAFKKSGLPELGIKLVDVKEVEDLADFENSLPEIIKIIKKLPILNRFIPESESVAAGMNALYDYKGKRLFINLDQMPWALVHEMGHARNKYLDKFGKILNKMRMPGAMLASLALASAIHRRKKIEGEEPKGIFDKVATFFKNNCGKLTLLGMTPIIMEEALATKNGLKEIKDSASAEAMRLIKGGLGRAWLTYLGIGLAITTCAVVSSKVRDAIAKPKEIKQ